MAPLQPPFSPAAQQPENTPQSQSLAPIAAAATAAAQKLSTTPELRKAFSPRITPQPLTAAAALADERLVREAKEREQAGGTSLNPTFAALTSLQGPPMSPARMTDARTALPQSQPPVQAQSQTQPQATAGSTLQSQQPDVPTAQSNDQTSPTSMSVSSAASADPKPTTTAPLMATAMPTAGEDTLPSPTDTANRPTVDPGLTGTSASHEGGSRAYTFPPPPTGLDDVQGTPVRNMSLPNPGFSGDSPRTGSGQKRHKCPYCATDFTRHHNLKSHLLTHSQEKPFGCETCSARFRRLHDLKRHQKLHTGERPHICNKCGRKFARGDALARHNKGQGGCAGRRSSFGGPDGDTMEGVEYTAEPENMDEGEFDTESRRDSEVMGGMSRAGSFYSSRGPSTYPPLNSQRGSGDRIANMYGSSQNAPSSNGPIFPTVGHAVFAAQGIAESPKPLSPGISAAGHNRKSSLLPPAGLPAPASARGTSGSGSSAGAPRDNRTGTEAEVFKYAQDLEARNTELEQKLAQMQQDHQAEIERLHQMILSLKNNSGSSTGPDNGTVNGAPSTELATDTRSSA